MIDAPFFMRTFAAGINAKTLNNNLVFPDIFRSFGQLIHKYNNIINIINIVIRNRLHTKQGDRQAKIFLRYA